MLVVMVAFRSLEECGISPFDIDVWSGGHAWGTTVKYRCCAKRGRADKLLRPVKPSQGVPTKKVDLLEG